MKKTKIKKKDEKRFLDAYAAWVKKNAGARFETVWDGDNTHVKAIHTPPLTNDPRALRDWMRKVENVRGSIVMTKDGKPHSAEDITLLDETLGYFITLRKNMFESV